MFCATLKLNFTTQTSDPATFSLLTETLQQYIFKKVTFKEILNIFKVLYKYKHLVVVTENVGLLKKNGWKFDPFFLSEGRKCVFLPLEGSVSSNNTPVGIKDE